MWRSLNCPNPLSSAIDSLGKFVESSAVSIVLNLTLIAAMGVAVTLGYRNDRGAGIVMGLSPRAEWFGLPVFIVLQASPSAARSC